MMSLEVARTSLASEHTLAKLKEYLQYAARTLDRDCNMHDVGYTKAIADVRERLAVLEQMNDTGSNTSGSC